MTDHITEAQSYQSIGELAPEAEQVLTHQQTWDGIAGHPPTASEPITQAESPDTSFWNRRGNRQALAVTDDSSFAEDFFSPVNHPTDIPPLAGYGQGSGAYDQTPTAATNPAPFRSAPDGVIDGASAAQEQSGNRGITQ